MRYVLCAVLIVAIAGGCRKKPAVLDYYAIGNEQIKKGLSIDSGSYFVYMDSATGMQNQYDVFGEVRYNHVQELDYYYDYYAYVMRDRFGSEIRHYCRGTWDNNSNKTVAATCAYTPGGFWCGNTFSYINIMAAPFKAGTNDQGILCTHQYNKFYPSYTVRNKAYTNVYEIDTWATSEFSNNDTIRMRTYYSADTGLVKYTTIQAGIRQTWELERNHILRH